MVYGLDQNSSALWIEHVTRPCHVLRSLWIGSPVSSSISLSNCLVTVWKQNASGEKKRNRQSVRPKLRISSPLKNNAWKTDPFLLNFRGEVLNVRGGWYPRSEHFGSEEIIQKLGNGYISPPKVCLTRWFSFFQGRGYPFLGGYEKKRPFFWSIKCETWGSHLSKEIANIDRVALLKLSSQKRQKQGLLIFALGCWSSLAGVRWKKRWDSATNLFTIFRQISPPSWELNSLRFPWWDSVGRYFCGSLNSRELPSSINPNSGWDSCDSSKGESTLNFGNVQEFESRTYVKVGSGLKLDSCGLWKRYRQPQRHLVDQPAPQYDYLPCIYW